MTGSGFLDPPAPLTGANDAVFWVIVAITMVMQISAVVLVITETVRLRTTLPLIVFASAMLWLPNEASIDTVLGFQYAADAPAGTLFDIQGREIPLEVLGVGAMFFLFTWAIYQMLLRGRSTTEIIIVGVVAGIIDWPFEWFAIHHDIFEYYGDNPSLILGLPFTSMVQNCTVYLFMASVLAVCAPHLKGWRGLLFLPIIPGCYYAMAFICTWPAYLALHGGWSDGPFLLAAAAAAAMNAYIPIAMIRSTYVRDAVAAAA